MLPILWRAKATADLTTILKFIAERSPQSAFDLHANIKRAVSQLPKHPHMYRRGRVAGTRELVVNPNYIVVYRISASAIEIVAVMHSRRAYP
ncbi:MAG: type II toxin-antitoxin system RelE/ParE family toxin [Pseudomonadota bacterium]